MREFLTVCDLIEQKNDISGFQKYMQKDYTLFQKNVFLYAKQLGNPQAPNGETAKEVAQVFNQNVQDMSRDSRDPDRVKSLIPPAKNALELYLTAVRLPGTGSPTTLDYQNPTAAGLEGRL